MRITRFLTEEIQMLSMITITVSIASICIFFSSGVFAMTPVKVTVTKAEKVQDQNSLVGYGTVNNHRSITLHSQANGIITQIAAKDGSYVKQGQALFKLNQVQQQASIDVIKQKAILAQKNYQRMKALHKNGYISEQQWDNVVTQAEVSKQQLNENKAIANDRTVYAPYSGYLGISNVHLGSYVNSGDELTTLTQKNNMNVTYSLPANNIDSVSLGQKVTIVSPDMPHQKFKGSIIAISPQINNDTQSILLEAKADTNNNLRPGMFVQVKQSAQGNNAISIPGNAVQTDLDGKYVFKDINHKAVRTTITMNPVHVGNNAIVTSGLTQNDTVIVGNSNNLSNGSPIETIKARMI
jgi:membrane fusion protein (multidrug efflux system)